MTCPICGRETASNAVGGDKRCGPCHNFNLVALDGPYSVLVRVDFDQWIEACVSEILRADNLATYRPWLHALRLANDRKRLEWIENG